MSGALPLVTALYAALLALLAVALGASLLSGRHLDPAHDAPLPDPLGLLSNGGDHGDDAPPER